MVPNSSLLATMVVAKAQEMMGVKNPYITFKRLETLCQGDELLTECLREMMNYSLRYAETVCRFEQIIACGSDLSNGEREEIERLRTGVHDATIVSINTLSRQLCMKRIENRWISQVSSGGRAGYGKFAILIAFEVARRETQ